MTAGTYTIYRCTECGVQTRSDRLGPALYECDCGEVFNREHGIDGTHQCPGCYHFARKIAEVSCPACDGAEVVPETQQ